MRFKSAVLGIKVIHHRLSYGKTRADFDVDSDAARLRTINSRKSAKASNQSCHQSTAITSSSHQVTMLQESALWEIFFCFFLFYPCHQQIHGNTEYSKQGEVLFIQLLMNMDQRQKQGLEARA